MVGVIVVTMATRQKEDSVNHHDRKSERAHKVRAGQAGFDAAMAACRLRGAQVTPLRENVLAVLCAADRPLGAYELREILNARTGRTLAAPSIYRALDFLCDQGVAARIESRNAYVACAHPDHDHACIFLVCEQCSASIEIDNDELERLIGAHAKHIGFTVKRRVVELSGLCASCQQIQ